MIDTKLNTLLKVAECRNFTAAAKSLNLTQPAVSQHIRALEDDLGVKLFERAGNRLILTKEGEKAVNTARAIRSLYNSLLRDLSGAEEKIREMRIGITHTVESNRITEALARYASQHEDLRIRLITDRHEKLCRNLKNYELDLVIIDGMCDDPAITCMPLDTDRLVMVAAVDHSLANRASVTAEELQKEKMILRLPASGTGNMFLNALKSKNMTIRDFNVILEMDNIATIKDLVRQHYGISVLAESACLDEIARHKLAAVPVAHLDLKRNINILTNDRFEDREFLEELLHIYKSGI